MTTDAIATSALQGLVDRFDRVRARTRRIFDLVEDEAYYSRPISLRHPLVFYEGHLSAFAVNALIKKALGQRGIDERLEILFARGIDPDTEASAAAKSRSLWPSRDEVRAYNAEADRRLRETLMRTDLDRPGHPLLDRGEAAHAIVEHEEMHQETLLYMWHRLPFEQKRRPAGCAPVASGPHATRTLVEVPAGIARVGVNRDEIPFGWDNEFPRTEVAVPAFAIENHDVTNDDYLEFVNAGGYRDPQWWSPGAWEWVRESSVAHPLFWESRDGASWWRGMFELLPLPGQWPVYVSHAEAEAFAKWRGMRLPTEAEFWRAAYGSPDGRVRPFPWGTAAFDGTRGNLDFRSWDPSPIGTHPAGASAWGVHDLVGNGWEWTSTIFAPFAGFSAMGSYPEYSADFFDGEHYVIKGASPATAKELVRPSFRNWFRPHYPYVYAAFRCVRP
jgi:ergothioneine biosynthesis protein EgtB